MVVRQDKGERAWVYLSVRLLDRPLEALARAFVSTWTHAGDTDREAQSREWATELARADDLGVMTNAVRDVYREKLHLPEPSRFVVIVDQMEELYHETASAEAQKLRALVAAHTSQDVLLLTSLRADYYGRFQADRALFSRSTVVDVPGFQEPGELEALVRAPATLLGATFDTPHTPKDIADDTRGEPGSLPLLTYALEEMWKHMLSRGDGVLRWADYTAGGRAAGVLESRLNDYRHAHQSTEGSLRTLFLMRLVQAEEGHEISRRRARRSECSVEEWSHVEVLASPAWRLLVAGDGDGDAAAEVAHEAILRAQGQLAAWIQADRKFIEAKNRLEIERRFWDSQGRGAGELLRGARLTLLQDAVRGRIDELSPDDAAFLEESGRHEDAERLRRWKDQNAAERSRRRWMLVRRWSPWAAALVVAIYVTVSTIWQSDSAQLSRLIGEAEVLNDRLQKTAADDAEAAKSSNLRDENESARVAWAEALAQLGDVRRATTAIAALPHPSRASVLVMLAERLRTEGRTGEIAPILQQALSYPAPPSVRNRLLAQVALDDRDVTPASLAATSGPLHTSDLLAIAAAFRQAGRTEQARAFVNSARANANLDYSAVTQISAEMSRQGATVEARQFVTTEWEERLAFWPPAQLLTVRLAFQEAWCHFATADEVVEMLQPLGDDNSFPLRLLCARAMANRGDVAGLTHVLDGLPSNEAITILNDMVRKTTTPGDPKSRAALDVAIRVGQQQPNDEYGRRGLVETAVLLSRQGEPDRAAEIARWAIGDVSKFGWSYFRDDLIGEVTSFASDLAYQRLDAALKEAESPGLPAFSRLDMWLSLARERYESGDPAGARQLVSLAGAGVENCQQRRQVAIGFAAMRQLRDAQAMADGCQPDASRLSAYADAVSSFVRRGFPGLDEWPHAVEVLRTPSDSSDIPTSEVRDVVVVADGALQLSLTAGLGQRGVANVNLEGLDPRAEDRLPTKILLPEGSKLAGRVLDISAFVEDTSQATNVLALTYRVEGGERPFQRTVQMNSVAGGSTRFRLFVLFKK